MTDDEELAAVVEDYKKCDRDELYRAIRMWRSHAIQWQEWADHQLKLMGYEPPEMVMHGRLGTQELITLLVGRLMGATRAP